MFDFARKKIIDHRENDDLLFEYVLTEMENKIIIKSLWAKAIAFAEGNEQKIESLYMQYRVQNIKDQFIKLDIAYNDMKKEVLFNKIKLNFSENSKEVKQKNKSTQKKPKEVAIKENDDGNEILIVFGFIGGLFLILFIGSWVWYFLAK